MNLGEVLDLRKSGSGLYIDPSTPDCLEGSTMLAATTSSELYPKGIFYLYDHLGNTRVTFQPAGTSCVNVTNYSIRYLADYYPYGKLLRSWQSSSQEKYLTTQHERDQATGLDFRNARYYDSETMRFYGVDPLAEKYAQLSPFVYVADNPIVGFDPDGMRILFVNGHYQPNWIGTFIGSDKGGQQYWGNGFTTAAQGFFKDFNPISTDNFIDGSSSWGGDMSGENRYNAGYEYAKANLGVLTADMAEGETFKMVTHSEGSAYGAGIAQFLIENGYTVETVIHLSADEGDEFSTPTGPNTYQLGYAGDWVTGNKSISGVDKSGLVKSGLGWQYVHGSTRLANVFRHILDLTTVRTQQNIGVVKGKVRTWRTQVIGTTVYNTEFSEIDGMKIFNEDGTFDE